MPDERCNQYELNEAFVNATEWLDNTILDLSYKTRRLFINLIPRGVYQYGQGIIRTQHRFRGAMGDQAALTSWTNIQVSRPAAGQDPGYDACRYEADRLDYSFESLNYTGFERQIRSRDVCLKDIVWMWEFEQQLKHIFGFLGEITLSTWENFARENYLKFCADAGQIYVLSDGAPNATPLTATYNPLTSDQIQIDRDIDISTLEWRYLQWYWQFLALGAPNSNIARSSNDMPIFGLVVHPDDFDYMINNNADIREDFRYQNADVLVENYGAVKEFKGYALTYDMLAPRYRVVGAAGAATLNLERVLPYTTEATTVGEKPIPNPDYINAEYAMGIIYIKDVFETLVPPTRPANPGGGTQFGVVPGLNGDFRWVNIPDRCENMLGEKGFHFARFEGFVRPMDYSDFPIAFLYKRCVNPTVQLCEPCDGGVAGARLITVATEIIGDGEAANAVTQVRITLDECLECEAPAEVGIDYNGVGGADVTAVLVQDSAAPTYVITFTAEGDWVAGGTIVAGTSTIVCQ